ncbi:MAG: glucose 1-dehydrogenase [Acidobacteriales bacterium]|nr:glucose 1-dehydrogenase [Terriglobales bacterium]
MGKLKGKVAVVTGASKGIGAAIAKAYGAEGASVVVNYRSDKTGAEAVVKSIQQAGGKAIAVKGDVAKRADVQNLFAETKKTFGKLDVLVNNAGVYEFRPLEEVDEEHFHRHFDLNVLGLLFATQEAAKSFNGRGSVINISSVASLSPRPSGSVYSATKGAVDVISRALAVELGPRQIRVNSLSPGFTETEGTSGMEEAFRERAVQRTPLGRAAQPDDIAKVAVFLASDDSGWITGEVVPAGGGIRL